MKHECKDCKHCDAKAMKINRWFLVILLILGTIIALSLRRAAFATDDKLPIMETYYCDDGYEYLINTVTDVVYIRYEFYKQLDLYNLIHLYKADGTIMTGSELKSAAVDEIVIYDDEPVDDEFTEGMIND